MEFPILIKEIRTTLRRREVFFSAFLFYAILTSILTVLWIVIGKDSSLNLNRDQASRLLFFGVLGFGFVCFCLHAGLSAARIMVIERDRKSDDLIRTAPVGAWRFLFQKMLTPFFVEWLFFLGILPALSLIFLLGGVSPREYAYQMTNLAVWLNTSILVGLWISAGAKTTAKARSKTIGMLLLIALLLPFLSSVCIGLSYGLQNVSNLIGYKQFLKELVEILAYVSWPLFTLSPLWMVGSWYSGFAGLGGLSGYGGLLFSDCPALLPWLIHTGLQILLFLGAVRRWRKTRAGQETATSLEETRSAVGFLRWLRRGRAVRRPHPPAWRAFFKQEDYEVFKKGRFTKVLFAALFILFFAFLYGSIQYLDTARNSGVRAVVGAVLPISGLIALLSALGFATNAMRREKDRDCGVLLLMAPLEERSILFGKWIYYQWFALRIFILGSIVFVLWYTAVQFESGFRYNSPPMWAGFMITLVPMLVWVPLLSLLGIYHGLQSRIRSGVMRLLAPILLLWLGGGFFVLAVSTLESVTEWETFWRVVEWTFYDALSPAAMIGAAGVSVGVKRLFPNTNRPNPLWRVLFGGVWLSLAFVDVLLGQNEGAQLTLFGERLNFGEIRFWSRWVVLPLCTGWMVWAYLATRSREWWRKRLTSLETVS